MNDIYDLVAGKKRTLSATTDWFQIQKLALEDDIGSKERMKELVLDVQGKSVKLPIIRRAVANYTPMGIKAGTTILCDIVSCSPFSEIKLILMSKNVVACVSRRKGCFI
jgi:hypothetical protein